MSYTYNTPLTESEHGSYQDRFLEYSHNWQDDTNAEKKRVKIICAPKHTKSNKNDSDEKALTLESLINEYIVKNGSKIKIIDIKYIRHSVMIIYEPL